MEHREQIRSIVTEVVRRWRDAGGRDGRIGAWAEVRRQLRGLRDTSTTLNEDERTALQFLRQI